MFWMGLIGLISGGLQAHGSAQSGLAGAEAAEYNRETAYKNAEWVEAEKPIISENARTERRRLASTYHAAVGDFRAKTASSGLDPNFGSARWLQDDARIAYASDRRTLGRNEVMALHDKDIEAYNLRRQGYNLRQQGNYARRAGALEGSSMMMQSVVRFSQTMPASGGSNVNGGT